MNSLHEKVAIVTGGTKGIGKGIVKAYLAEQAKVYVLARDVERLQQLAEECVEYDPQLITMKTDISSETEITEAIKKIINAENKIDILCHNAGIYPTKLIDEMTTEDWDEVHNTNLRSTFILTKHCCEFMKEAQYGKIVYISSITGPRVGNAGLAHYSASKSGMNGFMKTAAIEYAKHGITVNAIEPGNIMSEGLRAQLGDDYINAQLRSIPMGRLGTADDIAKATLFFSTDASSFITGQSIIVDGGQILPESHFDL